MNTQMILNELSLIFQEILKRDNIVLASETTAQDVEGWNSLTNMLLISRIILAERYSVLFFRS